MAGPQGAWLQAFASPTDPLSPSQSPRFPKGGSAPVGGPGVPPSLGPPREKPGTSQVSSVSTVLRVRSAETALGGGGRLGRRALRAPVNPQDASGALPFGGDPAPGTSGKGLGMWLLLRGRDGLGLWGVGQGVVPGEREGPRRRAAGPWREGFLEKAQLLEAPAVSIRAPPRYPRRGYPSNFASRRRMLLGEPLSGISLHRRGRGSSRGAALGYRRGGRPVGK